MCFVSICQLQFDALYTSQTAIGEKIITISLEMDYMITSQPKCMICIEIAGPKVVPRSEEVNIEVMRRY